MPRVKLYGFDGSTCVRTVKMLFAEKGFTAFDQVPVNVLKGEPHAPEHLKRHPFGKVPRVSEWWEKISARGSYQTTAPG